MSSSVLRTYSGPPVDDATAKHFRPASSSVGHWLRLKSKVRKGEAVESEPYEDPPVLPALMPAAVEELQGMLAAQHDPTAFWNASPPQVAGTVAQVEAHGRWQREREMGASAAASAPPPPQAPPRATPSMCARRAPSAAAAARPVARRRASKKQTSRHQGVSQAEEEPQGARAEEDNTGKDLAALMENTDVATSEAKSVPPLASDTPTASTTTILEAAAAANSRSSLFLSSATTGVESKVEAEAASVYTFQEVADLGLAIADVGAKGLRLAELAAIERAAAAARPSAREGGRRSQFTVPSGACVTTDAYTLHLAIPSVAARVRELKQHLEAVSGQDGGMMMDDNTDDHDAALGPILAALRDAIVTAELNPSTQKAVEESVRHEVGRAGEGGEGGGGALCRFAVRSSGSMEDLANKSFAGQYDSILNVPEMEVCGALKQCWASQWGDHVIPYLQTAMQEQAEQEAAEQAVTGKEKGEGGEEGGGGGGGGTATADITRAKMGVVVQRMILPVASGVLFTIDPRKAERSASMLVEAVHGLGEGLVSGEITPHSFTIDFSVRPGGGGGGGGGGMAITANNATSQRVKVAPVDEGSIATVATTAEEQASNPISNGALQALCVAGQAIATHYGTPQDIEWCITTDGQVHVVQVRTM